MLNGKLVCWRWYNFKLLSGEAG